VRFSSKDDCESACNKLNNTEYEGRTITVRLDRFA
jgi:RNA recognition motif-containing protein